MGGGLLNIKAVGAENAILTGNPNKTFFKCTYKQYTNFSMQKFRLDFDGKRYLRLNEESVFTFKVKRYAELLMDAFLVVTLPHIWSPIFPPDPSSSSTDQTWIEYGYKWIENLGTQMIKKITISCGGHVLGEYTGQYLYNIIERDFDLTTKQKYYNMTGNVAELNDPANANNNVNQYPNAYYTTSEQGPDPSIRSRKLYIPINAWFGLNSYMALPLVSMQYNELQIEVTIRPVKELFVIKNVSDPDYPTYVQPNFNDVNHAFYRFLNPPPSVELNASDYTDQRTNWNADVHLLCTYAFLSDDERNVYATHEQQYLMRDIHEYDFFNVNGTSKFKIESRSMVANWMLYLQRDDVYMRNEWSNYTNWPYNFIPYPLLEPTGTTAQESNYTADGVSDGSTVYYPDKNLDGTYTGYLITPLYTSQNDKNILLSMGILFNGDYRENVLDAGVYQYMEKYLKTTGNSPDGLYCYNFSLDTDCKKIQPTGAINASMIQSIELEVNTLTPTLDSSASFYTICDPVTNTTIGVNKSSWQIYDYTFNMKVMEERYNIITFMSGNAGLMYAR